MQLTPHIQKTTPGKASTIPEHVVGFGCFVTQVFRFLVTAISAGLTDSASHHQADIEGGDQVFTNLQGGSCQQNTQGLLLAG